MVQGSQRTGFTGSALVRLLVRLTGADVRESREAFAERLSQWLGWTDAISLSSALNSAATGMAAMAPANPPPGKSAAKNTVKNAVKGTEEAECERLRAALARAISEEGAFAVPLGSAGDYLPYRRRYVARQQGMASGIEPLRERLRSALAARSPDLARLAAVDIVMERALGVQEHRLLSALPALLEGHFERLRRAEQASALEAGDPDGAAATSSAWLEVFRKDMQEVLLAELDFRLQPIEGLLEALRQSSSHGAIRPS
jgi:hypothetical protein